MRQEKEKQYTRVIDEEEISSLIPMTLKDRILLPYRVVVVEFKRK